VGVAVCEVTAVMLDESDAVADSVATEIVERAETVAVQDADAVAQVVDDADVERDSCGDSLPHDVEDEEAVGGEVCVEDKVEERLALVEDDPEAEGVEQGDGLRVGVGEGVDVPVPVQVGVCVFESVLVELGVCVDVGVLVAVSVVVVVCVVDGVGVDVDDFVGVRVGDCVAEAVYPGAFSARPK
jgi:hypothetical protein